MANQTGTKLFIEAAGRWAIQAAQIRCPSGDEDGQCSLSVDSYQGDAIMHDLVVYAVESFKNFELTTSCRQFHDCFDDNETPAMYATNALPYLYCTASLDSGCFLTNSLSNVGEWQCVDANSVCQDYYTGNRILQIEEKIYRMNESIFIKTHKITIQALGYNETDFIHTSPNFTLISCESDLCEIELSHLTYRTENTSLIMADNGGRLRFNNVHFQNEELLEFIFASESFVEFTDCTFAQNAISFTIENNATVSFENCIFNGLQWKNSFNTSSLITVQTSHLSLIDSTFENIDNLHSILQIVHNSNVSMINCVFANNSNNSFIWMSTNSFGKILNTSADCSNKCIHHMDSNLYIDQISAANKTIFGSSNTLIPTYNPTISTMNPSKSPTPSPTFSPSLSPSLSPTQTPTFQTLNPTQSPTFSPTSIGESKWIIESMPDTAFSASSHYFGFDPHFAKFSQIGWAASSTDKNNAFLQVNLGTQYVISKVATKGCPPDGGLREYPEWVEKYKLSYSLNAISWKVYGNFSGNTDAVTTKIHNLSNDSFVAQYLRFSPLEWWDWPSMKVEAFGYINPRLLINTPYPTKPPTIEPALCCECQTPTPSISGCDADKKCEELIKNDWDLGYCGDLYWGWRCGERAAQICESALRTPSPSLTVYNDASDRTCCECRVETPFIPGCEKDLECEQTICSAGHRDPQTSYYYSDCCNWRWAVYCVDWAIQICDAGSVTTLSPTVLPTVAPTEIATPAPTILEDDFLTFYAFEYDEQSLLNEVDFINFGIQNGRIIFMPCSIFEPGVVDTKLFDDISDGLDVSVSFDQMLEHLNKIFVCIDYNLCFIQCSIEIFSCFQSHFVSNTSQIALFECKQQGSCQDALIEIEGANEANILCDASESCKELNVYVHDTFDFVIECVSKYSCQQMIVNVTQTTNASIHCYSINACDGLRVHSDKNEIKINIYSFSKDIQINVPSDYVPNALNCNPNNAYLRLDGLTFDGSLQRAAMDLFDGNMPCEDVIFSFSALQRVDCEIKYEYFSNNEINQSLSFLNDVMQCFNAIYIDQISDYECFGTKSPTTDPTKEPSTNPTIDPTVDPTTNPTFKPTQDPTANPTLSPTASPSLSPSFSPSLAPTTSPSRHPTSVSDYDAYMNVTYLIANLSVADVYALSQDFVASLNDIRTMIESAYVNHQKSKGSNAWTLHFYEFFIDFRLLNDFEISFYANKKRPDISLTDNCWREPNVCYYELRSVLFCQSFLCGYIQQKVQTELLQNMMTTNIKNYLSLSNEFVHFQISEIEQWRLLNPPQPKKVKKAWYEQYFYWILFVIVFVFIFAFAIAHYYKVRMRKLRAAKAMIVCNPLVLLMAIGDYEPNIDDSDKMNEIDGYLPDLKGVEHDVDHMTDLFAHRLNYDVLPKSAVPRTKWNECDMKEFLEESARFLSNNIESGKKYDSLVLIVSCHGLEHFLLSSDYRKYSQKAVHRTFSYFSELRTIPRFILFDCCQGVHSRELSVKQQQTKSANTMTKRVREDEIFGGDDDGHQKWTEETENPDHLLGRVNAANSGFTSRLDARFGSVLIFKMYSKYIEALDKKKEVPFIHEVFDEIQTELQLEGKQLPECVWNDDTRYLVFKKKEEQTKTKMIGNMLKRVLSDTGVRSISSDAKTDVSDLDIDPITMAVSVPVPSISPMNTMRSGSTSTEPDCDDFKNEEDIMCDIAGIGIQMTKLNESDDDENV